MKTSQSITAIAPAFVKAQAEFQSVGKAKTAKIEGRTANYAYKYADLAAVFDEIRPVLGKHGLGVIQTTSQPHDSTMAVTTTILHESGEWIEGEPLILPVDGDRAQSIGSAVTYARRYSLGALLGIVTDEDDDGAAAARQPGQRAPQARTAPKANGDAAVAGMDALAAEMLSHLTKLDREKWEPCGVAEVHQAMKARADREGTAYTAAFLTDQIKKASEAAKARHAEAVAAVAKAPMKTKKAAAEPEPAAVGEDDIPF